MSLFESRPLEEIPRTFLCTQATAFIRGHSGSYYAPTSIRSDAASSSKPTMRARGAPDCTRTGGGSTIGSSSARVVDDLS